MSLASPVPPARAAAAPADFFAPVRLQYTQRAARLEAAEGGAVTPDYLGRLLDAGRVDEALKALPRLKEDSREADVVRARVYLTAQDYPAAQPVIEAISRRGDLRDPERQVWYQWLFAVDDGETIDRLTRGASLDPGTTAPVPDLLAAGKLAYNLLNYGRADSCFTRALERVEAGPEGRWKGPALDKATYLKTTPAPLLPPAEEERTAALSGLGQVAYKLRDYDGSLERIWRGVAHAADPEALMALAETLIRLGRTDDAITAVELAIRFDPYQDMAQYYLGNGYARKNYTELAAAYPAAFADAAGRAALAAADSLLEAGDRRGARTAYEAVSAAHPGWADARVRRASLDFEDGRFAEARDACFAALGLCPEYGRAHAVLAKALESLRFNVDVHRPDYEKRFAAAPMPDVPGIETFVSNWKSLSPRHQKRVALSIAPWKQFIPVLVAGGSTYYIKPMYMLLSETPGQETLRDQRISYDSRLWDDVRGCGGYHTVTGVEDVERTIFDRYNTVLHELTHQVHSVLTAEQGREIQEHYRRAKESDDRTSDGFLSRYAGGSVFEYFAEGANALESPRRDVYDPRDVVRERLEKMDPDLMALEKKLMAQTDVSGSYPVAFVNAGQDRLERGDAGGAIAFCRKALDRSPTEETALTALTYALSVQGSGPASLEAADRALAAHPTSGAVVTTAAEAFWHGGRGLEAATKLLRDSRPKVRPEDRYLVDEALVRYAWIEGDAGASLAAADSVLAYQSDSPEGLWGKAGALALADRWDEAFPVYDQALRLRTGIVDLRCDFARDLIRARRLDAARSQLAEAAILEAENPTAEALRGWIDLEAGDAGAARKHLEQALKWGPWEDLARILLARVDSSSGDRAAADTTLAPVRARIAATEPPGYVYQPSQAAWRSIHELPAVERALLK